VRDESYDGETGAGGTALAEEPSDLRSRVRAYERGLLLSALRAAGGNQRRAAAMLGLLATTFHEKLKRHGLRPRPADPEE
jgi:DNA-binding NtrC family response regulator